MSDDLAGREITVTISDQIACVEREIKQRERVYPRLIERGSMSINKAREETLRMQAVLETLRKVQAAERLI